jgi:hypothetical protein
LKKKLETIKLPDPKDGWWEYSNIFAETHVMKEWGFTETEWNNEPLISRAKYVAYERASAKMQRYEAHLQQLEIDKGKVTGGAA